MPHFNLPSALETFYVHVLSPSSGAQGAESKPSPTYLHTLVTSISTDTILHHTCTPRMASRYSRKPRVVKAVASLPPPPTMSLPFRPDGMVGVLRSRHVRLSGPQPRPGYSPVILLCWKGGNDSHRRPAESAAASIPRKCLRRSRDPHAGIAIRPQTWSSGLGHPSEPRRRAQSRSLFCSRGLNDIDICYSTTPQIRSLAGRNALAATPNNVSIGRRALN